MILSRIY